MPVHVPHIGIQTSPRHLHLLSKPSSALRKVRPQLLHLLQHATLARAALSVPHLRRAVEVPHLRNAGGMQAGA